MSRYIDADALKEHIEVITYEGMWHTSETDEFVSVENIENAPTIDAVSVVRCKECKHWRNTDAEKIPTASIVCGNMHADDFCSYGERREP